MTELETLRYPIGRFDFKQAVSPEKLTAWIGIIEAAPARMRDAVAGLDDAQLDTRYRPDGWTIRQVVHHVADSHINSYVRFKLAMTEDVPTIRPYHEERWAELEEARTGPVDLSLDLIEALHRRWVMFLRNMAQSDFDKNFRHPELGELNVGRNVGLYAWHCEHHLSHITRAREREGW